MNQLHPAVLARATAGVDEQVWSETDDGGAITLVATAGGMVAIGVEPEGEVETACNPAPGRPGAPGSPRPPRSPALAGRPPSARPARRTGRSAPAKQAALVAMLQAPDGASTAEISAACGLFPHTTRGAISCALRKKLGLEVQSDKIDGRGAVYSIRA